MFDRKECKLHAKKDSIGFFNYTKNWVNQQEHAGITRQEIKEYINILIDAARKVMQYLFHYSNVSYEYCYMHSLWKKMVKDLECLYHEKFGKNEIVRSLRNMG